MKAQSNLCVGCSIMVVSGRVCQMSTNENHYTNTQILVLFTLQSKEGSDKPVHCTDSPEASLLAYRVWMHKARRDFWLLIDGRGTKILCAANINVAWRE